jgi:Ser/Thr protein kinase RdoA (MazF antagonist)
MNNPQFTQSELTWLTVLRSKLGLPVPEPVQNLDGQLLTTVSTPGLPQGKVVSLMRWVDGRHYAETSIQPYHAKAWGQLTGSMHQFAAQWTPPDDFNRFHWDWDGQLGNGVLRTPVDQAVASMPIEIQEPFIIISKQLKDAMESIGKGPDAYGMIHSDMYLDNVLFKAGKPRLIDFEDCGFGYWMLDIGIVLAQFRWTDQWNLIHDAFLEGYLQMHNLSAVQLEQLDLFMAMPYATNVLWASAMILEDPAMRAENEKWREIDGKILLRFFNMR